MASRHSFLSTTGLIRAPSSASIASKYSTSSANAEIGQTKSSKKAKNVKNLSLPNVSAALPSLKLRAHGGVVPLGPRFVIGMAVALSLLFIGALSCAFIGAEEDAVFKDLLNDLAVNNPGVSISSSV
jgi:hypothetical protein